MGNMITLTASDGFKLGGYRADPAGAPKGGVVVIQEIFGVNHHIRSVCDRVAEAGYAAIAPAIFDRIEPLFECGYSVEEMTIARKFVQNPDFGAFVRGYDTTLVSDAHTTEDLSEWGAPPPDKVVDHTNLYWQFQAGPGRTAEVVAAADLQF